MIIMDRCDVLEKDTWDLRVIYDETDKFNSDYEEVRNLINDIKKYENTMLNSAKEFYETLNSYYSVSRRLEKLYCYANLLFDTDTSDNVSQSLKGKVTNLYALLEKNSYFIVPNILKLEYSDIERFYKEVPELKEYEIALRKEFRFKEHTLSDNEEKLLSSLGKMLGNNYDTYELFKDCDLSFGDITLEDGSKVTINNSNYSLYIENKNREIRRDTFVTLYKTYKQYKNTFASLISNNINEDISISKIKKYNSAIECSLYKDEIDLSVYDNLISSVNDGLSILYKYYDIKKKVLGVSELHLYDVYVSMLKEYNKEYKYDDAVEIVKKALGVLGEDYIKVIDDGIKKRWIDVYPTKNKRTGGYSSGGYDTYPYILLNYQDKYNDMSTLAHELGHSMHSYYARSNNSYIYGDYSIFVAEVASTVNELLLAKYMLKNSSSKEEKLYILNKLMELFRATIFRQTMFAEFERDIYNLSENDEVLTADKLCDMYYLLNKKYFGDNVVIDDEIRYEWERIPHFYYNFYVYKYATGLSYACNIVNNILSGKENAVKNYINFLKCGRTKNPRDSLLVAGVDITKKEVVDNAIKMFDDILNEFNLLFFGE